MVGTADRRYGRRRRRRNVIARVREPWTGEPRLSGNVLRRFFEWARYQDEGSQSWVKLFRSRSMV